MACVNPAGTLTSSAQAILAGLQTTNRPEDIAEATGMPLYPVRSSLRELTQLGLVVESSGSYMEFRQRYSALRGRALIRKCSHRRPRAGPPEAWVTPNAQARRIVSGYRAARSAIIARKMSVTMSHACVICGYASR